jgi:hypothetical protein
MEIKKSAYAQVYSERIREQAAWQKDTAVCISAAPAAFDGHARGFTGHVARPARSIRQSFGVTGDAYTQEGKVKN